jgi:hypothetical protein
VRPHHAEGLPDAKVEGTAHPLEDVPPEGAQAACQRAPACASPSSIPWQVSRAAACSTSNSC